MGHDDDDMAYSDDDDDMAYSDDDYDMACSDDDDNMAWLSDAYSPILSLLAASSLDNRLTCLLLIAR